MIGHPPNTFTIGKMLSSHPDAIMTPSHTSYSKYGYVLCVKVLPRAVDRRVFQHATPATDLLVLYASDKAFDTALYMQSDLSR